MNVNFKFVSQNWAIFGGLTAFAFSAIWGLSTNITTLKQHGTALDELKITAQATAEKTDQKFELLNTKLDKISDNTNYLRGKVDEMGRKTAEHTPSPYPTGAIVTTNLP